MFQTYNVIIYNFCPDKIKKDYTKVTQKRDTNSLKSRDKKRENRRDDER
jgi:hypothetical protein